MNKVIVRGVKLLDRIIGPIAIKIPILRYKDFKKINKILVIRPGGIGDAALLLPSLKTLIRVYPNIKLDILCESRNRGVFEGFPYVKNIFNYQSIRDLIKLLSREYDIVIDTEQSHFLSAFLSSILKAGIRAGFSTNGRDKCNNISVSYSHKEYELYSFNKIFSKLIPNWPNKFIWDRPYIHLTKEQYEKVEKIVFFTKKPIVCIFPGASIKERIWPAIRWAKVAEALWDMGFYPVLLGSRYESKLNKKIDYYTKSPIMDLTGALNLAETVGLFRRSRLLLSIDSGILHLAVIEGLATVSLFGPGIVDKWGPKGDGHVVVCKYLNCSPCTRFGNTPPCPRNALCMKLISVDDVMDAVNRAIKN